MPFPMKKKPSFDIEAPEPMDKASAALPMKPTAPPMLKPEAAPEESGNDYGANLIADIESAGAELGMDADMSRRAAGTFFSAAAKCLSGGGESAEQDASGETFEAE